MQGLENLRVELDIPSFRHQEWSVIEAELFELVKAVVRPKRFVLKVPFPSGPDEYALTGLPCVVERCNGDDD